MVSAMILASRPLTAGEPVSAHDAWSRATPPGAKNGVAYLVIKNSGAPDRLLDVTVDGAVAGEAQIHTHVHEGGMMQMNHLETLDLPTGETAFEPGGLHIMLMGLSQPLKADQSFELTLTLENAAPVTVSVPVRDMRR